MENIPSSAICLISESMSKARNIQISEMIFIAGANSVEASLKLRLDYRRSVVEDVTGFSWNGSGSLAYAELGTLIPKSGAEYAYFLDGFGPLHRFWGPLPAFLYSWINVLLLRPLTYAIGCLSVAAYTIVPLMTALQVCPNNFPQDVVIQLTALVCLCMSTDGFLVFVLALWRGSDRLFQFSSRRWTATASIWPSTYRTSSRLLSWAPSCWSSVAGSTSWAWAIRSTWRRVSRDRCWPLGASPRPSTVDFTLSTDGTSLACLPHLWSPWNQVKANQSS